MSRTDEVQVAELRGKLRAAVKSGAVISGAMFVFGVFFGLALGEWRANLLTPLLAGIACIGIGVAFIHIFVTSFLPDSNDDDH